MHNLTDTILNSALAFPHQLAFRYKDQAITYEQLVDQSNRLAHLLLDRGLQKGDRVGIHLGRCLETAIAVYGIMRAGGVYVPLDPSAPSGYLLMLVQNCDIDIVITQPSRQDTIRDIIRTHKLRLVFGATGDWPVEIAPWERLTDYADHSPAVSIRGSDLAYIMYTSGSTGLPKGITHTHQSGRSYARLSADLYHLKPQDRLGSHAPLHFDISTLAYFTGPMVGATSVIIPEAHARLPASMTQLVQDEQLTVWYSAPLALIQMVTHGALEHRDLGSLRWILFGGELFPPKYLRKLMKLVPQARFCNVYGPAEVNQCTYYNLPAIPDEHDQIPLGKIWGDTKMLIHDQNDRPVPNGQTGELLISSPTMMNGYWRNPELTQQSIFTQLVEGKELVYYRTGDLVKIDEYDRLLFMGRKDRQVKTRGYRVELEMVEAQLLALEEISEAAAFAVSNGDQGKLIEVAVVTKPGVKISREKIIKKLQEQLPAYAVPRNIHIPTALPRTSTGKVDHPRLKESLTNGTI